MMTRLLYGALMLASLAMLMFIAGFAIHQFGLALLVGLVYLLAGKFMLLAFGLLILLGLWGLGRAVWLEVASYCRHDNAFVRRLWFLQSRHHEIEQFQNLKCRQIEYLALSRRQCLLAADNRRQATELFDSISRDLQVLKSQIPKETYREFYRRLRKLQKQADLRALLDLRQQIPCP